MHGKCLVQRQGVRWFVAACKRRGLQARPIHYGLVRVNGYTVQVRAAHGYTHRQRVRSAAGTEYVYDVPRVHFNLHTQGRPVTPAPDFWVLVDLDAHAAAIVPGRAADRLTYTRHVGIRPRRDRLVAFDGRFDLLEG
jgi:hypothetical protein